MRGSRRSLLGWVAFTICALLALIVTYLVLGKSLGDALVLAGCGLAGACLGLGLRAGFRRKARQRRPDECRARRDTDDHRSSP